MPYHVLPVSLACANYTALTCPGVPVSQALRDLPTPTCWSCRLPCPSCQPVLVREFPAVMKKTGAVSLTSAPSLAGGGPRGRHPRARPQPLQGWRCGPRKVQQRWVSRACNYPDAMIVILRVNTRPLLVGRLTFESARALGCLPRVLIPRRPIHRVITVALNLRMQIIYVSWWRCSMSTYQSIFSLPGIRKCSRLRSGSAIYYQRGVNSWQQITCKLQGSLCRLS